MEKVTSSPHSRNNQIKTRMGLIYSLLFVILLTAYSCGQKHEIQASNKKAIDKISLIEYTFQKNSRSDTADIILLSVYEIDAADQIQAYKFNETAVSLMKSMPEVRKSVDSIFSVYPSDTILPAKEAVFYHGPYYMLIKEALSGEVNVIDFDPYRISIALFPLFPIMNMQDYKPSTNTIQKSYRTKLIVKYKKIVEQKVGIPYVKVISLDSLKENNNSAQQ